MINAPSPEDRDLTPEEPRASPPSLRRHWRPAALIVLVAVLACVIVTQLLPTTYTTQTQVLLRPQAADAAAAADASSLVTGQVNTFAALVSTPSVLQPAITQAGVDIDAETLADDISVSVTPQTAIIVVEVSASSAQDAARLAAAIAASLTQSITTQSTVGGQPLLSGEVVEEPLVPTAPSSPNLLLNLLVAVVVGAAVAGVVVVLREASARRRSPGQ